MISFYYTRHSRRTTYNIFLLHKTQENLLYYLHIQQDTAEPLILTSYYTRQEDIISDYPVSCEIGR
jgi:hypothetical protein